MGTILIIDDSQGLRKAFTEALQEEGYQVLTAAGGLAGIAMAKNSKPDLIILDLLMPAPDGIEVLRTLKNSPATACIPVVIASALWEGNAAKLIQEGAAAYFEKEKLTAATLKSAVANVLGRSSI